MEINPLLPNGGQKLPRYFKGYLEFFMVYQNGYVSIPQFLAEPWLEKAALNFCPCAIVKYTGSLIYFLHPCYTLFQK